MGASGRIRIRWNLVKGIEGRGPVMFVTRLIVETENEKRIAIGCRIWFLCYREEQ